MRVGGDLNKSYELNPNDAVALAMRGDVKRGLSQHVEALADLNKALELKPNDAVALATRGDVKRDLRLAVRGHGGPRTAVRSACSR